MTTKKSQLTPREKEVYNLLLKGYSAYKIGEILGVSYTTVNTHRAHIRDKLLVNSKYELMADRITELEDSILEVKKYLATKMENELIRAVKMLLNIE